MNGVPYKPIDFKFVFDTRNKLVEKLKINLYPQGPYVHNSPDLHPIKAQHLWKIYEYYEALRYSNETLPDWLTENMIFDMEESNKLLMKVLFEWNYLKQASGGAVYANTILEEFQNKMKNFQSLDIQLLCAQEIVVTTAVSALINSKSKICDKTFEPGVVKHGTALITELYKNKKKSEYFVKVFYWNPNQDEPKQIKYDECKGECTFEKFKEFLKNSAISESKLRDSALCKTK
ncbi:prostatic acid phosphatase-like [Ctenocephalides felis]|uniref:prostatic acid phosphatase-like n=1 Tax=Ctenocephalides felis TaxID=7515 RepID=UPI000E6E4C0F|nr:prostatic acid phosphatase-like [Ctenocephalides felis]